MQPRNISFKSSSFPGLMSDVMFSLSLCALFFQIRIFTVIAFAKHLLCTTPPEGFCGRIPSPSFFMYLYMKEVIVFVEKKELELLASTCLLLSTGKTWVDI